MNDRTRRSRRVFVNCPVRIWVGGTGSPDCHGFPQPLLADAGILCHDRFLPHSSIYHPTLCNLDVESVVEQSTIDGLKKIWMWYLPNRSIKKVKISL
jgi:hypothetical protein